MSGMDSIGACHFDTNIELSYTVAVMCKIGGWEEENEQESQIGARSGACMWIYTKAGISLRSKDRQSTRPVIFFKKAVFLLFVHCHIFEVPGVVQWELLWYSAPSDLNEILLKSGVSSTCHDKIIKTSFTPLWRRARAWVYSW